MSIRNSAKAVVLNDGKLLLVKCRNDKNEDYYTLPGGGQNQYETMAEAVARECLEETGYDVEVRRFLALYEEIVSDEKMRMDCPQYTHKIFHIFSCKLKSNEHSVPSEMDGDQISSEWVYIDRLSNIDFYPRTLKENIIQIINYDSPMFLGSNRI